MSKPSVLVGMSGGVDSSVSAALLLEAGFNVTGAYMKNWTLDVPGARCPWADDLAFAKRTAVRLGIDFRVYDFQEAYKRDVVDYMVAEYAAGRTPNPDVMCNQEVKFGLFLQAAEEENFDFIATGHYARTEWNALEGPHALALPQPDRHLLRAADTHKDQTYFLYRMTQHAIDRTIFPLGNFTKPQVRELAAERNLPSANKPDSQGICFVGEASIRHFLRMYVETKPGDIIHAETGKKLGAHEGAIYYTLGQRKGLNLSGGPWYVVGKDMDANVVLVSESKESLERGEREVALDRTSWVAGSAPAPGRYLARTRHTGQLAWGILEAHDSEATFTFEEEHERVAAGQSVVLYDGDICLGGGIAR